MGTRWEDTRAPRGEDYDARWRALAAEGRNVHGEADLVDALLRDNGGEAILDAGCGTGRVAIELAHRGYSVTGVDADAAMLDGARRKAPELSWLQADLAELPRSLDDGFDAAVLAGNVMIFVAPGTEAAVVAGVAATVRRGGLVIAGFQLRSGRLLLADYDAFCVRAGLTPMARWATWDREPYTGGDYAVSVHRTGGQERSDRGM